MARPTEQQLYRELVNAEFSFIERGIQHIDVIYDVVKGQCIDLCDDNYYCNHRNNQPEWKHVVRKAMQRVRKINDSINFTGNKGYWNFL
jgi:hypothetical protein